MDYTASMLNNWGWCLCCEKLAGLEVNERSQCLRTVAGELSRLSSHLIGTGVFGQDVGVLVTSVMWAFNWREEVLQCLDDLSGARMMYNFMRPGGVSLDAPEGWSGKVRKVMDDAQRDRLVSNVVGHLLDGVTDFQLPTIFAPTLAPNSMSVRRESPRHMTVFPGGGSLARAR